MIKMIFSDMDGTLLDGRGQVPEGFDALAAELAARGVRFAPASGRQYFSLAESFPRYEDEFLFLAENGTNVVYRGETLFTWPMEQAAAHAILEEVYAADPGIFCVFCGLRDAYALEAQRSEENVAELRKYYTHAAWVPSFAAVEDTCVKVSFFDVTAHSKERIEPLVEKWRTAQQVVLSSDYWLDIMAPGANKGIAVRAMQKHFGVRPEECAAFGDYLNDREILGAVGYSFAMANAHPAVKAAARYETASNEEGGVLLGIRRLMAKGLI